MAAAEQRLSHDRTRGAGRLSHLARLEVERVELKAKAARRQERVQRQTLHRLLQQHDHEFTSTNKKPLVLLTLIS